MNEKSRIPDRGFDDAYFAQNPTYYSTRKSRRSICFRSFTIGRVCYAVCVILMAWFILHTVEASYRRYRSSTTRPSQSKAETTIMEKNATKVALEAHIMSKCPDAKACLEKLIVPAMIQINDKVDFQLSYIGSVDPDSDDVSCMHGPPECLGNIILLCAAHLYPSPKLYLGFANCMISDYPDIPQRSLVENCALEHSLNFDKINGCISDEDVHGINLLRNSVEHSRKMNITTSCTIRLEGKVRCIRDGGTWKNCEEGSRVEDLVRDIKNLYNEAN